jgi:hypothetical protein
MSTNYNDPTSLYLDENQLRHGSIFESSNVEQQQAFTDAVLTLIPIGGAVRAGRAAYYASQGVRRTGFMRQGKWVSRFRSRGGSSRFVKPPARFRKTLGESFHTTRHGYSKAHAEINRRLPFPRTRRFVDKWQGRAEFFTRPTDFLVRKLAGRLVPGGIYTIAGIKYVASFGSGPADESSPTDQTLDPVVPDSPIIPVTEPPTSSTPTPPAQHNRRNPPTGGWTQRNPPRRPKHQCPPGHYYSFKHRRCMKSKFSR